MDSIERKTFDYLAALTALVVVVYVAASVWALLKAGLPFAEFAGAIGPMAGLLVGYWVRGQ